MTEISIGTTINKNKEGRAENLEFYAKCADYCNMTQKAIIEDKGDYYEVVPMPAPSAEELQQRELVKQKAYLSETNDAVLEAIEAMIPVTVPEDGDENNLAYIIQKRAEARATIRAIEASAAS